MHTAKVSAPLEADGESPVTAFLRLERFNAVELVQFVHQTLAALSRAIRGTAVLSNQTRQLASALLKHEVDTLSSYVAIGGME